MQLSSSHTWNKEDLSKIVDLMLAEVNQTLAKKDIDLEVSQAAKDFITEEGYDEVMGVRPSVAWLEQQIRDKVTDFHFGSSRCQNIWKQIWKMVV